MVNIRTIMPSKLLNFVNIRSDIGFDGLHGAGCDTISIRVMGFLQLMLCAKFFHLPSVGQMKVLMIRLTQFFHEFRNNLVQHRCAAIVFCLTFL